MLVFWKQKLVLFAVPKTGTTALEAALLPHASAAILNPPNMKHTTVRKYANQLSRYFEQRGARPLERMAVMREPVDWLGSWYRYRARPEIAGSASSTAGMSFDDFVAAWLSPDPPGFAEVGRQSRFLSDEKGRLAVDHLFGYGDLAQAVAFLEDRLSVTLDLPRRNVSPAMDIQISPAMRERMKTEAPEEFDLWDSLAG